MAGKRTVLMNGAAIIFLGLVAYGTLHIHNDVLQAWQWCVLRSARHCSHTLTEWTC